MSDLEKSREELIDELTVMRRLVELSPDAVFIQSDRKLVFANSAGAQLLGAATPQELIGKQIVDVVSPTRWQNVQQLVQDLLEEKRVPRIEKKFIRLDGTSVDVEVAAIPFTYKGKAAMQMVAHDITRRRKAEEALRESEERFRQLVDNAPLGFIVFDLEGNVQTINPSIVQLLRFSSDEALKNINVFQYPPLVEAGITESILKCRDNQETIFPVHQYKTSWGEVVWLQFSLNPLRNTGGRLIAIQALVEDITDRKKAEKELLDKDQRIQRELRLANTIQSSLFPVSLPQISGATLAATAVAANEVGGDYCDLFITKGRKLGIAVGDVMGKGVPAALFVAMTYAFVRNFAFDLDSPAILVNRVNRSLFPQLEFSEQFITLAYGIYDPETRELLYTNAGHNPPIVYRAETGECEFLEVRDFFLGGRQDAQYREGRCQLYPGDIVLFYTDGLKEGKNKDNQQFGMERILSLLKESSQYDPASIQELINYEFMEFLAGEPPYDDVTMAVIKIDES